MEKKEILVNRNEQTENNLPIDNSLSKMEAVKYLLNLSVCQLETVQLEEKIKKLNYKINEIKKKMERTFYEEPKPPVKKPFPSKHLLVWVGTLVGLFLDYKFDDGFEDYDAFGIICLCFFIIVYGIGIFIVGISRSIRYKRQIEAYKKTEEERLRARENHREQENKRINALKKELKPLEEEQKRHYLQQEEIKKKRKLLSNTNIMAKEYCEGNIPIALLGYFYKGRANTLMDAINIFHMEKSYTEIQEELYKQREEISRNYAQLVYQQNMNIEKLSEQIESVKNELATQQLMDSLYTNVMLDNISKRL